MGFNVKRHTSDFQPSRLESKATIYGAYKTHDSLFLALQTLLAWYAAHKESLSLEKAEAVRGEIC